jgi:hypothetical protein
MAPPTHGIRTGGKGDPLVLSVLAAAPGAVKQIEHAFMVDYSTCTYVYIIIGACFSGIESRTKLGPLYEIIAYGVPERTEQFGRSFGSRSGLLHIDAVDPSFVKEIQSIPNV